MAASEADPIPDAMDDSDEDESLAPPDGQGERSGGGGRSGRGGQANQGADEEDGNWVGYARGARRGHGSPSRGSSESSVSEPIDGSQAGADLEQELFGNDDENDDVGAVPVPPNPLLVECSVTRMDGYNPMFLGENVRERAPVFDQTPGNGWHSFKHLYGLPEGGFENSFIPKRALVIANIPSAMWSSDATRFKDFITPTVGAARASNIAALIGLIYTPLSKGIPSGRHEEVARNVQNNGRPAKPPDRVSRYMFITDPDDPISYPMFCFGLERIYESGDDGDEEGTPNVVAIRLWHFIFDEQHSTSALVRELMDETIEERNNAGIAHSSARQRRGGASADARRTRTLAGGLDPASVQLATFGGTQYLRITSERDYMNVLLSVCGESDTSIGRHYIPQMDQALPVGSLNARIRGHESKGGLHPAAPEWAMNAKRPEALQAGLVHFSGEPMNVDHEQLDPDNYFNPDGSFKVPEHVADRHGFYIMTDPSVCNPFDAALPFQMRSADRPGPHLMELYRDQVCPLVENLDSPELLDGFFNLATSVDQTTVRLLRGFSESVATYDTMDMSDDERRALQKLGSAGFSTYGTSEGQDVIEPIQKLKDINADTQMVLEKLVTPWAHEKRVEIDRVFSGFQGNGKDNVHAVREAETKRDKFQERYANVMRDLGELQLSRMQTAFNSKSDRETIPAGYLACYDGLMDELKGMPNGTANIAYALNMQLMDSQRSVWSSIHNWIMNFFESDCFGGLLFEPSLCSSVQAFKRSCVCVCIATVLAVDGRDWRVMDELLMHCFGTCGLAQPRPPPQTPLRFSLTSNCLLFPTEQYADQTMLLLLCGPKVCLTPLFSYNACTFKYLKPCATGQWQNRAH